MTRLAATTFAIGLVAAVQAAQSAPIVHDSIPEFASIVYAPLGSVPTGRANLANLFDVDGAPPTGVTMLSLGRGTATSTTGGSLTLTITPNAAANRFITGGAFQEATFNRGGNPSATVAHREAAEVWLGNSLTSSWTLIGTVTNIAGGALFDELVAGVLSWTITPGTDVTSYAFTVLAGAYDSLRFVDVSRQRFGTTTNTTDGFDLTSLRIFSDVRAVPEPASLALLSAALLGLGLARLRAA